MLDVRKENVSRIQGVVRGKRRNLVGSKDEHSRAEKLRVGRVSKRVSIIQGIKGKKGMRGGTIRVLLTEHEEGIRGAVRDTLASK